MKNKELSEKIKIIRNRKGYSQEYLAEKTGLSLRTIQRIEKGETEPRGDSIKRLAIALDVLPDDIVNWTVQEDKGLLMGLNLSALSFISAPFFGVIVPLIIWVAKKDKVLNINKTAKEILNFQITWVMLLFIVYIAVAVCSVYRIKNQGLNNSLVDWGFIATIILTAILYLYNITMIVINALRINKGKDVVYAPKIEFVK